MTDYSQEFSLFSQSLEHFISEVNNQKLTRMATDEWTVKDVLRHIVFWHENYAANYKAQVEHTEVPLPEQMSTINKRGVALLKRCTKKELLERLDIAHKSLFQSIVEKKIPSMTYSKGGRTYQTHEFLSMIARHFETHARQVRRAK